MIKKYLLLLFLCLGKAIFAQQNSFIIPDTLRNKSYDYLFERVEDLEKNKVKQSLYLKSFLSKALFEKNTEEIVNGYKNYVHYSPDHLKLVYADSMIYTAKKSKDNALIGSSYLSKGIVYYAQKKHNYALDNYLLANTFISQTNDSYLLYKAKYNIANIKYYLRFYDEAISLFKECITYFKDKNSRAYLNSIHLLGLCYNKIGNYGLCSEANEEGIAEGKRLDNLEMESYFFHSEGVNQYFKNNYATAIKKITYSLPAIRENEDFANESVGYFYIGKSYWALKKPKIALPYFRKVDGIFDAKSYIRPDLLENYELIIKYYKSQNNLNAQLHYIEKLLKADSILDYKYEYLSGKIHKEYDTKEILSEKIHITNQLDKRKYNDYIFMTIITILFFVLLLLIYRHIRNKRLYKQKFDELMKKSQVPKVENKNIKKGLRDINEDTVSLLLKQLEKFEKDKKFLEKDLTLVKLTAAFESNTKYLSKIIYHYRGKKFVDYLNDLKIEYLISLLKTDKKIRNYTNKALAEEAGFSSTQRFANAFLTKTGMPTSYFIGKIKKELP
ncbi:AraC family transcriptional regulator [Flavobacterium sp. GT3P67]|uniref:AraC family transcriptional regulator n=1 Tax=Flavobacterium sp. GT3P67 TaxID=2541722 RepID=UPI0010478FA5|nr:AraC family transcriptional regulator [Flavobacterium sp. GT3P67]TDE52696.1 AraC family transcriptional regulator [Flavobacterium sp. GT3P67]